MATAMQSRYRQFRHYHQLSPISPQINANQNHPYIKTRPTLYYINKNSLLLETSTTTITTTWVWSTTPTTPTSVPINEQLIERRVRDTFRERPYPIRLFVHIGGHHSIDRVFSLHNSPVRVSLARFDHLVRPLRKYLKRHVRVCRFLVVRHFADAHVLQGNYPAGLFVRRELEVIQTIVV